VSWTTPAEAVHHYVLTLTDGVAGTSSALDVTSTRVTVSGLKSATPHTATLKACLDEACATSLEADAPASGQTEAEYWQVQGTGNSYSTATKIVSDGNTYGFGLPYGPWAGALNGKVQLYYNPLGAAEKGIRSGRCRAARSTRLVALVVPPGLGVRARAALLGRRPWRSGALPGRHRRRQRDDHAADCPRCFDGRRRQAVLRVDGHGPPYEVMYLDSRDGYVGRDFNAGAKTICNTLEDYSAGGGCAPTVVVGVQGDAVAGNQGLGHARQFKVGYPTRTDWRWNGDPCAFM